MTISYIGKGADAAITTSAAVPYPTLTANDLLLLSCQSNSTATPSTPSGWTSLGTPTTGGGLTATLFIKTATGSETGNVTVSGFTSGTGGLATIINLRSSGSGLYAIAMQVAVDSDSSSTAVSATGSSWTIATNDMIVAFGAMLAPSASYTSAGSSGPVINNASVTETSTSRYAGRTLSNTIWYNGTTAAVTAGGTGAPTYTATMVGANGAGVVTFVHVSETPPNVPPVANAGTDQSVAVSTAGVTLNGTGSTDSDGTIASYLWSQTSGTTVTLSSTTVASPTFTAPGSAGTLVFQLQVTDDDGATHTDSVTITVTASNVPPVADAGSDQTGIAPAATVTLNGSGSTDSDGTIASYLWAQTAGTSVTLSSTSVAGPTFTAPSVFGGTTLTFELTVTDNLGATDTDTVNISVTTGADSLSYVTAGAASLVGTTSDVAYPTVTANDGLAMVAFSDANVQPANPSGWGTGTTVAAGGGLYLTQWKKTATGSETGFVSITGFTGGTKGVAWIYGGRSASGAVPKISFSSGADNDTSSTAYSATGPSWTLNTGDLVLIATAMLAPSAAYTANASSPLFNNASVTETHTPRFGGRTGTDTIAFAGGSAAVTAGGTGVPVFTATGVGANAAGITGFAKFTLVNIPPVANAGTDQTVTTSTAGVTLNGTGSTDSDGTISTYAWSQTSGTSVTLSSTSVASPTFTAPGSPSTLVFQLTVTDNDGATHSDSVTITVNSPSNVPPVANAGTDQSKAAWDTVTLNGSGSTDSDGTITTYAWTQTSGSPTVTLSSTSVASPTFTAPSVLGGTTLVFQLTVTDDDAATHSDSVTITVASGTLFFWNASSQLKPAREMFYE